MAFEDLLKDTPLIVEESHARTQKKRIVSAVNLLAITTALVALIFGPLLGWGTSNTLVTFPAIIEGLLFLTIPIINFYGKYRFGLTLLFLLHTLAIGYFCVVLGPETNLTAYVVFLLVAAFMLFSPPYLLPTAVCLIGFMIIAVYAMRQNKIIDPIHLTIQNIRTMNFLSNLSIIFLTTSLLYTYIQERRYYEKMISGAMEQRNAYIKERNSYIKEKDSFIKRTSHEFRGPIQIMNLILESASPGPNGSFAITNKEYDFAKHAVLHATQLINDILDWSLIEAGKAEEINMSVMNFHDWLKSQTAIEKLRNGQVTISLEYASAPKWIKTDAIKLTTLLQNLIINAVKFAKKTVSIVAELQEDGKLLVTIRDDGDGIPEGQANEIFKPFVSTSNQAFKSTGLGLAIAMAMKQALKGELWLESDPGVGGTTFRVSIPVEIARYSDVPRRQEIDLSGRSIILIDDDLMQRTLLAKLLRSKGIEVRAFGSSYEGIRALRKNRADLIITDVELSEINGFELLATLRLDREFSNLPVILTSGNKVDPEELKSYDLSITGFILKPFGGYIQISREIQRLLTPKEFQKNQL